MNNIYNCVKALKLTAACQLFATCLIEWEQRNPRFIIEEQKIDARHLQRKR